MEQKSPKDESTAKGQESLSYQRRMWKNFQEKTKPWLSPKLGSERRGTGGAEGSKKESGLWMFKRKKKQLDRVFSSSQPNLCCSTPAPFEGDKSTGSDAVPGTSSDGQPLLQPLGAASGATGSKPELTAHGSPKLPVSQLIMYQQKSSSLGSACFEKLVVDPAAMMGEEEQLRKNASDSGINIVGPSNAEPAPRPPSPAMYQLDIILKKGNNLAIRDRTGTSDPYVKFKIAGKEVFRSKTIHKNLNPVWDERVSLLVETLKDPLYVKVFDYDFGLQDDFMGTLDVTLDLKDPQYPEHNLGSLELAVTLSPKEGEMKDAYQSMRLSDVHRKAQLWRGIVSISLIEGRDLQPMDNNGLSDPYVKFRMGHQKYKSKTIPKTLNPQWREQFDFHLYEEQGGFVDITLWDKDAGKKDDFMGRCTIDLSLLSKEHTHKLDLPLEEGEGVLVLLVTLTASAAVSISDLSVNMLDDPHERHQIMQRYSMWRSFHNLKDVGVVQVKVIRAEGLMAADVTDNMNLSDSGQSEDSEFDEQQPLKHSQTRVVSLDAEGNNARRKQKRQWSPKEVAAIMRHFKRHILKGKLATMIECQQCKKAEDPVLASRSVQNIRDFSDPFCVVELSNDRLQTHTVYKNLNPEWNKVFTFNVKDIHSVLEVTVYDEDRDRSADFLGKVAIPLLNIQNGERKAYVLKSKELTGPTKGVIFLEIDVIFNALLLRNFNRVRRCIMFLINTGCYINSCFEWDSPQRSICAFVLFVLVVWNFELYMIPLALLLPLAWNYILIASGKDTRQDVQAMEDLLEDEDEDFDKDDKDSERKGFMNKLYAIQDVCISVQNALDEVASYGERIKNTFNWTVPFLSWLAIVALGLATTIIYFIPLRYIVLAWGVNKFTKKLRDPYTIDNNELLDFLSRVPSDVQV
ncbi:Multiple C2 and transmembrane domain-containing protein 1, partial [Nibea albiflora]